MDESRDEDFGNENMLVDIEMTESVVEDLKATESLIDQEKAEEAAKLEVEAII